MPQTTKKRSSPTMSREHAKELLVGINYDYKKLQLELNRILGTNYQNRDVWKWFNTTSPPLTVQLFLRMKTEEINRAELFKKQMTNTLLS